MLPRITPRWFFFRRRLHRFPFFVGRSHFYFPLSFITNGTLTADTLVVEKDVQEGADAFFLFAASSSTLRFPLKDFSFAMAGLPGKG